MCNRLHSFVKIQWRFFVYVKHRKKTFSMDDSQAFVKSFDILWLACYQKFQKVKNYKHETKSSISKKKRSLPGLM